MSRCASVGRKNGTAVAKRIRVPPTKKKRPFARGEGAAKKGPLVTSRLPVVITIIMAVLEDATLLQVTLILAGLGIALTSVICYRVVPAADASAMSTGWTCY